MCVVCTVVVRWPVDGASQILALRDELTSRDFDDPGRWWPEAPDVVGGRDRTAGGTWCASDVRTGVTALVLNRPPKRVADPGAPSRGVLPLLAVEHGASWVEAAQVEGMASFLLVLASPSALTAWSFDGQELTSACYDPGVQMFTSGGAEDGKALRYLDRFKQRPAPEEWLSVVEAPGPADDRAALVVRLERADFVFATVFGQLIESRPGGVRLRYSRQPWLRDSWLRKSWLAQDFTG